MQKQEFPLRTGWLGYRKYDVRTCLAHLDAMSAMEHRLAQEVQQGLEGKMAQMERENTTLRQELSRQTAAQAVAAMTADTAREKLEQLGQKLAAAHAEIRRYQTRLFACERQLLALRRDNAELEAACEQAREEAQIATAEAEKTKKQLKALQARTRRKKAAQPALPEPVPAPVQAETVPAATATEVQAEKQEVAAPELSAAAPVPPAPQEPGWQPKTELERLSVELIRQFDQMIDPAR